MGVLWGWGVKKGPTTMYVIYGRPNSKERMKNNNCPFVEAIELAVRQQGEMLRQIVFHNTNL